MKLNRDSLVTGSRYTALGFEFAAAIIGGMVAGYYLDDFIGCAPLFTFVFTIAGLYGAVRLLLWSLKNNSR